MESMTPPSIPTGSSWDSWDMEHNTRVADQWSSWRGQVVRIVRPRRRAGARLGTVRDGFWKGDEPWVVLQLPSGQRVAVAATWTDLARAAVPVKKTSPLLHPAGLMALARCCRELKARPRRRPSPSE